MERILIYIEQNLEYFILIFFRVMALVTLSPLLGRKGIPNSLKISLSLMIAYIILAINPLPEALIYQGYLDFTLLIIKEFMFGLALSFVTTLFFSVVQTAGQIIDMQMGFGMVTIFDVHQSISVPVMGSFLNILLLVTFFTVNGHIHLIHILTSTFKAVPVGKVSIDGRLGLAVIEVFIQSFMLVLNIAMPMIASGLMGEVIMGVIIRSVPQMNMFVVGIPLKVFLGFLILLLILPFYISFTGVIFDDMYTSIHKIFSAMVESI